MGSDTKQMGSDTQQMGSDTQHMTSDSKHMATFRFFALYFDKNSLLGADFCENRKKIDIIVIANKMKQSHFFVVPELVEGSRTGIIPTDTFSFLAIHKFGVFSKKQSLPFSNKYHIKFRFSGSIRFIGIIY